MRTRFGWSFGCFIEHRVAFVNITDVGLPTRSRLHDSLQGQGIRLEGLPVDAARPTTTKTRVIAHSQQVVRIDDERPTPLSERLEQELARFAED
jgi:bifunctional ADP-heptose synthase (sugar kinase/adenylyltransferase)